ncbi:hypothetical protein JTB14_011877 [Gonioctena quinquepunctata]|nr:hypothetical protein JTB14_011877 [Gonioctena quinquepunctata]
MDHQNLEQLFVSLVYGKSKYIIGGLYIPPNSDDECYTNHVTSIENLINMNPEYKMIIFGDYNLTEATWTRNNEGTNVEYPPNSKMSILEETFNFLNLEHVNLLPNINNRFLDLCFSHIHDLDVSYAEDTLLWVPQGSHCGPILFNLFVNDIYDVIVDSDILSFADDVKLFMNVFFWCELGHATNIHIINRLAGVITKTINFNIHKKHSNIFETDVRDASECLNKIKARNSNKITAGFRTIGIEPVERRKRSKKVASTTKSHEKETLESQPDEIEEEDGFYVAEEDVQENKNEDIDKNVSPQPINLD